MKITKQARRDAKQLFNSCQVSGLLDENRARQVVTTVFARKPRGYVGILSHFERLLKLDVARRTAKIESAAPLDAGMQASVLANLTQVYGGGLNVSFAQNPALIGGLRVQVGSDVYDGSVLARLNSLGENF